MNIKNNITICYISSKRDFNLVSKYLKKNKVISGNVYVLTLKPNLDFIIEQSPYHLINRKDIFDNKAHKYVSRMSIAATKISTNSLCYNLENDYHEAIQGNFKFYLKNILSTYFTLSYFINYLINKITNKKISFVIVEEFFYQKNTENLNDIAGLEFQILFNILNKYDLEMITISSLYNNILQVCLFIFLKCSQIIKKLVYKLLSFFSWILLSYIKEDIILVASSGHNMDEYISRAKKSYGNKQVIYLRSNSVVDFFKNFFNINKKLILSPNVYCSKNHVHLSNKALYLVFKNHPELVSFIDKVFKECICNYMNSIIARANLFNLISKKSKISLFISQYGLDELPLISSVLINRGVETVMLPHGTYVPVLSSIAKGEWNVHALGQICSQFNKIAIISRWLSDVATFYHIKNKVVQYTDGLYGHIPSLEIAYTKPTQKKIILLASTPKSYINSWLWIYETIDEYLIHVNSIISIVEELDDYELYIRFRSSKDLSLETFLNKITPSKSVTICTDGKFSDYLILCSCLVSFSSTTMEEAVFFSKPVISYDLNNRYDHFACVKPYVNQYFYITTQSDLKKILINEIN